MVKRVTYRIESEKCLEEAESVILGGGIIVYPTDTLYGLGVDVRNNSALSKLSELKKRDGPWSVAVSNMDMLKTYANIPKERHEFVNSHLPGKVTVILHARSSRISPRILGRNRTIGVRIPHHPFPVELTERLGFPITSTSVNRTGEAPLNDPEVIQRMFGNEIDLIVDGGILPPSAGSRIYRITSEKITILRNEP